MEKQNDVKPRPRVRFGNGVTLLARAAGLEVDPAVLNERLLAMSDDEFDASLQRMVDQLGPILRGEARVLAPPYTMQLENFALWQRSKGNPYWLWSAEAMEALNAKLTDLGPGCELIPTYAMSVQVKLPTGKLILINRRGEETRI